ncbi:MAG: sugar ABC transporter permease [Candidatus Hydrogenedentota bacterium]
MFVKTKKTKEAITGYVFLLPNIIGFITFVLLPVLISLFLSFTSYDLFGDTDSVAEFMKKYFIGFKNIYKLLFQFDADGYATSNILCFWNYLGDKCLWYFLGNTLYFMLMIPIGMAVSLALALAMNQKLKGIVVFRTIYFLPVISSMVACAILWRWIYNPEYGLLNGILQILGVAKENLPQWLSSTLWAKPAIMLMLIWKSAGYNMLLYLAALQGINQELYEAGDVDGATSFDKFWNITLPMLRPVNFFIIIMSIIGGLQMFGEIYVMTGGGPGDSTTTIVYYIYQNAFVWFRMGYAAALSWVLFVMIFSATWIQWKYLGQKFEI